MHRFTDLRGESRILYVECEDVEEMIGSITYSAYSLNTLAVIEVLHNDS